MSDDWAVGDLAVRVAEQHPESLTVTGRAYEVIGFEVPGERSPQNGLLNGPHGSLGLILAGVQNMGRRANGAPWAGHVASNFRKIRPDEHEACEPEFVTLIRRAKRPVVA
jgi:hypothetical protein